MKHIFIVVFGLQFFSSYALAGFIRLTSSNAFSVTSDPDGYQIHGIIQVSNSGSEKAFDVSKYFSVGTYRFELPRREIAANSREIFEFHEKIRKEQFLSRAPEDSTPVLSEMGKYPLKTLTRYQDANGHKFSAPEIIPLKLWLDVGKAPFSENDNSVKASLKLKPEGDSFEAEVELSNKTSGQLSIQVEYFTAEELKLSKESESLVLGSEPVILKFSGKNLSALKGSVYPVYVIASWTQGETRNYIESHSQFKVELPTVEKFNLPWFLMLGLPVVFGMWILYGIMWRRVSAK